MNVTLDQYLGCLAGLAVADALGTTAEFQAPGSFPPVKDMTGGGAFGLKPGEWNPVALRNRPGSRARGTFVRPLEAAQASSCQITGCIRAGLWGLRQDRRA